MQLIYEKIAYRSITYHDGLNWVTAVILIPSFSLACGVLTKTNRTFEVLYMIVWYLGPLNKMPYLDFLSTGTEEGSALAVNSVYLAISIGLLMAAYMSRRRLAQIS